MTAQDKAFMVHNIVTKSLRECLVPFDEWMQQVNMLEATPAFCIQPFMFSDEDDGQLPDLMMVPYPYKVPVFVEILKAKNPDKQTFSRDEVYNLKQDEIALLIQHITARISPFLQYSLQDWVISEIDENYDYGAIVHSSGGRVIPFEYPLLKSVEIGCSPMALPVACSLISKKDNDEASNIQYTNTLAHMIKCPMYDLWYTMKYTDEEGDRFNYDDSTIYITEHMKFTLDDIEGIKDYIYNMEKIHAKCMIIP